jgi:hypothetical protein
MSNAGSNGPVIQSTGGAPAVIPASVRKSLGSAEDFSLNRYRLPTGPPYASGPDVGDCRVPRTSSSPKASDGLSGVEVGVGRGVEPRERQWTRPT